MLVTEARDGETKDFPAIAVIDGRTIGLRVKVLKLDRGRVKFGLHLLDNGCPILTKPAPKA